MIFQRKIWEYKPRKEGDLIDALLFDRGITTQEEKNKFLNPSLSDLYDPFLMDDMQIAVERITRAISTGEKIYIYGDYDCDGITSTTILMKTLKFLNAKVMYFFPDRLTQGYGVSNAGIDYITEKGCDLVITVDCGISSYQEIEYAKSKKLDVIVTDHHELPEILPDALAVINPKIGNYPFPNLAGCGVAFKLAQALLGDRQKEMVDEIIDLAALGTIADIVPLESENRILATIGMNNPKNTGLLAMMEEVGINTGTLSEYNISFQIAPRINVAGRISDPRFAAEMLLTEDYDVALKIAKKLTQLNQERQKSEEIILEQAQEYISKYVNLDNEKVIIILGDDWHAGVIGITASKMVDKYFRPVIVLTKQDGMIKGSARSIKGVSIYDIMSSCKDLYDKFGGHEQASGVTFRQENFEEFKSRIREYASKTISDYQLISKLEIDAVLHENEVSLELLDDLEKLRPFGVSNPEPIFSIENAMVESFIPVGKNKNHGKLILRVGKNTVEGMAFFQYDQFHTLEKGSICRVTGTLEKNVFRGKESISIKILDIQSEDLHISEDLRRKMNFAIAGYLASPRRSPYCIPEIDSDIMKTINNYRKINVYTISEMYRLKDMFVRHNFYNYDIKFGYEIKEGHEVDDNILEVIFLPLENPPTTHKTLATLDLLNEYNKHIPTRDDVAKLYKKIKSIDFFSIDDVSKTLKFTTVKIMLGLMLLSEMSLIRYEHRSLGNLKIEWLDVPSKKIDISEIELFKRLGGIFES